MVVHTAVTYCFKRLSDEVLLSISHRDISRIAKLISDKGLELVVSDDVLNKIIQSKYVAHEGARSILGYIDREITSGIADVVLQKEAPHGQIIASFDASTESVRLSLPGCSET